MLKISTEKWEYNVVEKKTQIFSTKRLNRELNTSAQN